MKFGFESLLVIVFRLQNTDFILRSASAFFLILSLILKSHMNTWHIDFPCMLRNCSISRAIQSTLFSVSFMAHQVVCSKIRMKHSSLYTKNGSNPLLGRMTKCASVGLYEAATKHEFVFLIFDQNAPLVLWDKCHVFYLSTKYSPVSKLYGMHFQCLKDCNVF